MRLIDISHELSAETPVFPGDVAVELSELATLERDRYTAWRLNSGLHAATHVDAPMHLVRDARWISEFPIERFCGRGVLLDVRGENPILPRREYEERIREGDIVLLHTGWDALWGRDDYFERHPVVSDELGELLIARGVSVLGIDMPSPDFAPYALHKRLLAGDVLVMENLTNLGELVDVTDFEVMALPLKLRAEASFVRAVCRVG
ncbi:MAG: cyclase family protein [Oscillospiraceae bacterium]|jgi:kynurenine formamidase|nr:cyclase family protein [Oscillospiraceae bacterium]